MTQEQALNFVCDHAMAFLWDVPREALLEDLRTWEHEHIEGIAVISRRGAELHFITFGGKAISRRVIREALRPQMERYGYVETKTPRMDERQHRFNRLIGFRQIAVRGALVHYRMEKAQCRLSLQ